MVNMNVIYISNEDLLYKSFCRTINKPTVSIIDAVHNSSVHTQSYSSVLLEMDPNSLSYCYYYYCEIFIFNVVWNQTFIGRCQASPLLAASSATRDVLGTSWLNECKVLTEFTLHVRPVIMRYC